MAHHQFLRQLGLFTIPGFLPPEVCARWRSLAEASGGVQARIYRNEQVEMDEEQRKSLEAEVKGPELAGLEEKVLAIRADLERHFRLELGEIDRPRCLMYGPGDFFALHEDSAAAASGKFRYLERRRISVVVFLNEPNHPAEPYEGGELSFFGLTKMPGAQDFGFSVDAETGLLVAFPASTPHQVSRIVRGKRFTLVTWFRAKEDIQENHADHVVIQAEASRDD